jgi:hypothetical protein
MKIDRRKPVISGRASIIHASLTVKVLWKRQLERMIAYLISNDYSFKWEYIGGFSLKENHYLLSIDEICWAENLTEISRILEKCDYQEI